MRAVLLALIFIIAFSNAVSLPFKVNSVHVEMPHHHEHHVRGGGDSNCKDEFHKKCGKEVDALKRAIETTSVMGIIKGSVDVASCILNNMEDLFNHCKPKTESESQENVVLQAKTAVSTYEQMNMLNNNRFFVIAADSNCKSQWKKDCGEEVDKLKKAVEDTSITGIVAGAAAVVECAIKNMEDIYNHCKPSSGESVPLPPPVVADFAPIPSDLGPIDQVNVCVGVVQAYCGAQLDAIRLLDMSAPFETQVAFFKELEMCIEKNMRSIESECKAASEWEFPQADVHSGCRHHPRFKHALIKIPLMLLFGLFTVFMVKRCVRVVRGGKGCHHCCHSAVVSPGAVITPVIAVATVDEVEKGQVYQPLMEQDEKKDGN